MIIRCTEVADGVVHKCVVGYRMVAICTEVSDGVFTRLQRAHGGHQEGYGMVANCIERVHGVVVAK